LSRNSNASTVRAPLINNSYRGVVTKAGAEAGIKALRENAARLARDARLLLHAERYPSAAMLAAMALDEIARIPLLMELFLSDAAPKRERLWRRFREAHHDFRWDMFQPGQAKAVADDINQAISFVRTIGHSTECLGPGNWVDPMWLVHPGLAKELVATADLLCLGEVSMRGVEIWLAILQSTPKDGASLRALDRFHGALKADGLESEAYALENLRKNISSFR